MWVSLAVCVLMYLAGAERVHSKRIGLATGVKLSARESVIHKDHKPTVSIAVDESSSVMSNAKPQALHESRLKTNAGAEATGLLKNKVKYDGRKEPIITGVKHGVPCHVQCLHGSLTSTEGSFKCGCKCEGFWSSVSCDTCSLEPSDCVHGVLDKESCTCKDCRAPWSGPLCSTCSKSALDMSHCDFDPQTCSCGKCLGAWGGPNCDVCQRPESHCGEGSKLDISMCMCKGCPSEASPKPKSALVPYCSASKKCPLTKCDHFGAVDGESCTCVECPEDRKGLTCSECRYSKGDCRHGGILDQDCCLCKGCDKYWGGPLCEKCMRPEESCLNGGKLDKKTCKCMECDAPFGGEFCETCELHEGECAHGGKVCEASCRCHECDAPWTGPRCNKCSLTEKECFHGKVNNEDGECTCDCEMPWLNDPVTQRCSVCGLKPGHDNQCGYGTVPDFDLCSCVAAPPSSSPSPESVIMEEDKYGGTAIKTLSMIEEQGRSSKLGALRGAMVSKTMSRAVSSQTNTAPHPGKLVSCSWTGVPDKLDAFVGSDTYYGRTRIGYLQHLFVSSECTGGKLPDPREGIWMSSFHSVYNCGKPEQWSIISPNEQDGPGVMWYNSKPCDSGDASEDARGAAKIRIDFYLPSKQQEKSLHRCVWQGQGKRFVKEPPTGLHKMSAEELSKTVAFKPWQQSASDTSIEPADVPGMVDSSTGGLTKKFQAPEDSRFWADKIGEGWDDSAPGYHRHAYVASDCSNGLPPIGDRNRHCLVSHRWGESCGCDGDWAVRAGNNNDNNNGKEPPSVEWYTGQECQSARIATDFFCPNNEEFKDFQLSVHTCTFQGPGIVENCAVEANSSRSANDEDQPGQCRKHTFLESECTNGLPGLRAVDAKADCMVNLREFSQCGSALDLESSVSNTGLSVSWYTPTFSSTRGSSDAACSDAIISLDVICIGSCPRRCRHGGDLDYEACTCTCKEPWTKGADCEKCGLLPTDCHHGTTPDLEKCICVQPDEDSVWNGNTGDTCTLHESDCLHGGKLDKATCSCTQCEEPWSGITCSICLRSDDECKQGAKVNKQTCTCRESCPTWGDLCQRCPKGVNDIECSGRGVCDGQGTCECDSTLFDGDACEIENVEASCTLTEYSDLATFDGAEVASWQGRGEVRLFERVLRDGTKEVVNALVGGVFEPVSAVVGVAVKRVLSSGEDGAVITLVGQTGEQVRATTTKSVLNVGATQLAASQQGDTFATGVKANGQEVDAASGVLSVYYTGMGYKISTPQNGLEVTVDSWNIHTDSGSYRQFFDLHISAKLAKTGDSAKGGCGNFDGNSGNDFGNGDIRGVQQSGASHLACNQVDSEDSLFKKINVKDFVGGISNAESDCENAAVNAISSSHLNAGLLRFKNPQTGAIQEAKVSSLPETSAEVSVVGPLTEAKIAQHQKCVGSVLKEAVAACASFVPVDFPSNYMLHSDELQPLLQCYFFSCQRAAVLRKSSMHMSQKDIAQEVQNGVRLAGRMREAAIYRNKCYLPKLKAETEAAKPPLSLAMLASRYEDLQSSDRCPS